MSSQEPPRISLFHYYYRQPRNPLKASLGYFRRLKAHIIGLPNPYNVFHVYSPNAVTHILQNNAGNYSHDHPNTQRQQQIFGNSFFNEEQPSCPKHREDLAGHFHNWDQQALHQQVQALLRPTLEAWQKQARSRFRGPLNIRRDVEKMVLHCVLDLFVQDKALQKSAKSYIKATRWHWLRGGNSLKYWPSLSNMVFRFFKHGFVKNFKNYKADNFFKADFSVNELSYVLVKSYECISSTLLWSIYKLAHNEQCERNLLFELDFHTENQAFDTGVLQKLNYPKMLIAEVLRLYPPFWGFWRKSLKDDEIMHYHIPAGSELFINSYAMHYDESFWEQPKVFDPERFAPEIIGEIDPFSYLPFAAGNRACIADDFCQRLMEMILVEIYRHVTLHLPMNPDSLKAEAKILLRPKGNLRLRLNCRD